MISGLILKGVSLLPAVKFFTGISKLVEKLVIYFFHLCVYFFLYVYPVENNIWLDPT